MKNENHKPGSNLKDSIKGYEKEMAGSQPQDVLRFFLGKYGSRAGFSSSLGAEDQVITEMIAGIDPATYIFTLDTGRIFPETYDLIDLTSHRYNLHINILFPDFKEVETMVKAKGINLFYESVENRQLCCYVRKIEPLRRALKGLDVWISGLRKSQSITRQNARLVEWDEENGLIKVNPLLDWSLEQVWEYIKQKDIPYNKLHDQGFPSIGCQPCTRAIQPGEDIRAGRWWWENPDLKECGLHRGQ